MVPAQRPSMTPHNLRDKVQTTQHEIKALNNLIPTTFSVIQHLPFSLLHTQYIPLNSPFPKCVILLYNFLTFSSYNVLFLSVWKLNLFIFQHSALISPCPWSHSPIYSTVLKNNSTSIVILEFHHLTFIWIPSFTIIHLTNGLSLSHFISLCESLKH